MNSALEIIIFIIQGLMFFVLLYLAYRLFRFVKTVSLDKRFGPYSVEVLEDTNESLFDMLIEYYKGVIHKLSKVFVKSKVLTDYSNKYIKYSSSSRVNDIEKMNYISTKFIIGISCVLLLVLSVVFKPIVIDLYLIILVFLLGFFLLDIYLIIDDKIKRKRIEKDMNKAIIIMNNAFKSGYSIMQAIYLVHTELEGPISIEFKKMYMDITFGLNMEVVFKRFSERVNSVEANYMSASLAVLNKTGGNITQVFSSVERSSFTRKKLKDELDSVSASSRAVFKILVFIPIFLVGMLLLLSPTYFKPLFTNPLGILCLILSILIYVVYIIIIRKIVYVEVKL